MGEALIDVGVEWSLPDARLRSIVRRYVTRRAALPVNFIRIPLPARTDVFVEFYFDKRMTIELTKTGERELTPYSVLVGPQTFRRVDLLLANGTEAFTIDFTSTGLHTLLGLPMTDLVNQSIPADALFGSSAIRQLHECLAEAHGHAARVRISERFLLHLPRRGATQSRFVVDALKQFDWQGGGPPRTVLLTADLSERQIRRRFVNEVGVTPKFYARIIRLGKALDAKRAAPQRSWTDIAHDLGWFDQAHLDKDFIALAGSTPTTFPLAPHSG